MESTQSHWQDGFRRPVSPWSEDFGAAHDHCVLTYPGLCRSRCCDVSTRTTRPARSFLKMKRLIRPVRGFPRNTGGVPTLPQGQRWRQPQGQALGRSKGSDSREASFTCMGPPLTESPGRCQVIERLAHVEPYKDKHNRVQRLSAHARRNNGNKAAASGAAAIGRSRCDAFRERPTARGWQVARFAYRMT